MRAVARAAPTVSRRLTTGPPRRRPGPARSARSISIQMPRPRPERLRQGRALRPARGPLAGRIAAPQHPGHDEARTSPGWCDAPAVAALRPPDPGPNLGDMNLVLREPWTVERFLAWEDKQEGRHEFDGTRIFEMTGGSRAHQRIVLNLVRLLEDVLAPGRWDAVQEMRLELEGKVRYPDVAVVAGRIPNATKTLRDAGVLFEVLSEDTAPTDRHEKRAEYARLPARDSALRAARPGPGGRNRACARARGLGRVRLDPRLPGPPRTRRVLAARVHLPRARLRFGLR